MTLKKQTVSGLKWSSFSTVTVAILQVLQLAVLARLLDQSDFGLMAIVMVVIGFSQAFLDMGISNAIIHKQELSHRQLSTLYWVNILAGVALFVVVAALAPLFSRIYGEPELTRLVILAGLGFLIQPFGQQFMVLYRKELRFRDISKIEISGKVCNFMVSIAFAWRGFGVDSLVYGLIAEMVVQTLQFVFIGLKEHKPSFYFNLGEVADFLKFGAFQMGEKVVNYLNLQLDVILVGKLIGIEELGVYSVAKQLVMRPAKIINPIITRVFTPVMAKIQDDEPRLRRIYLKIINYLATVNFSIYVLIIVLAHEAVVIMLGDKWLGAVYIIQILAVFSAIRSTGNPVGSLLIAKGRANLAFYWNMGMFFYMLIGILFASQWGLEGVSRGLVILSAGAIVPGWYILVRPLCGAGFIDYHWQLLKPAWIAGILFLVAGVVAANLENMAVKILATGTAGALISLLFNYWFNKDFLDTLRNLNK